MSKDKEMELIKKKMVQVLLINEYIEYLVMNEKAKDKMFDDYQKQLEEDREIETEEWLKKYKPLIDKIANDKEFMKYMDEKPEMDCGCGSANVEYVGLGSIDHSWDTDDDGEGIQMYKWKCHTCGEIFEVSEGKPSYKEQNKK